MNDFIFGCPKCMREFRVLPECAGEVVQCPHCSQKMRIPVDLFGDQETPKPQEPVSAVTPGSQKAEDGAINILSLDVPDSNPTQGREVSDRVELRTGKNEIPNIGPSSPPLPIQESRLGPFSPPIEAGNNESAKSKAGDNSGRWKDSNRDKGETRSKKSNAARDSSRKELSSKNPIEDGSESRSTEINVTSQAAAHATLGGLPPVFEVESPAPLVAMPMESKTKSEPAAVNMQPATASSEVDTVVAGAIGNLDVDHRLPPQFAAADPTRLWRQSDGVNQILLPTADGGLQAVNERLVTIEYKGQKYTVLAPTPEEKRRRQIMTNIVSTLVAIAAIAGTIWILLR